jgi:hypothetical protein
MEARRITFEDVQWSIHVERDGVEVGGNVRAADDDGAGRGAGRRILRRLGRDDYWAWCVVQVTGRYGPFEYSDFLGGCSYRDRDEFVISGAYDDMRAEVLAHIQAQIDATLPLILP